MINYMLLHPCRDKLQLLPSKIEHLCPELHICGRANSFFEFSNILKSEHVDLFLVDFDTFSQNELPFNTILQDHNAEIVFISQNAEDAVNAFQYNASGYLIPPLEKTQLRKTIRCVKEKIKENRIPTNGNHPGLEQPIGIPTIDGIEILSVGEIIRFEGMQRCTRIVTESRSDIISSYNIGVFRKKLEAFGFFQTHKSHLVSINSIERYTNEGILILKNGDKIPISRRKKNEFFQNLIRIG